MDTLQIIANAIQTAEQLQTTIRQLYDDDTVQPDAVDASTAVDTVMATLLNIFTTTSGGSDYESADAAGLVVKVGSAITVLAEHMPGMAGSSAVVTGYSLPAMTADIAMTDGTTVQAHKWLTNDEVELATVPAGEPAAMPAME